MSRWCEEHDHITCPCPWCDIEELQGKLNQATAALEDILLVRHDGSIPDEWDGSTGGAGHAECRKIAWLTLQSIKGGESNG